MAQTKRGCSVGYPRYVDGRRGPQTNIFLVVMMGGGLGIVGIVGISILKYAASYDTI